MHRFANFELDPARSVLCAGGAPIALPPKAVQLLTALVERKGAVAGKEELMNSLWPDGFVEEGNLTQYVYLLRKTFKARGFDDVIQTVPRRGYRFAEPRTSPAPRRAGWYAAGLTIAVCASLVLFAGVRSFEQPRDLRAQDGQSYKLARYYWSLRTVAGLERSIAYLKQIDARAPHDASVEAAMADDYLGLYDYACEDRGNCDADARTAMSFARRAVADDGTSSAAHTSLAMMLHVFHDDRAASEREFRRAIALDPTYAIAHEFYGNALLAWRDIDGARHELQIAANLDPVSPATYAWLARDAYYARTYDRAVTYAREALALDATRRETRLMLGLAYERLGDYARARAAFAMLPGATALVAGLEARSGNRARARALMQRDPYDQLDLAFAAIALRDYTRALEFLRHADLHDKLTRAFLALDPRLDPVRDDPRFREYWS